MTAQVTSPVAEWSARVAQLEGALQRAEREALATIAIPPMQQVVDAMARGLSPTRGKDALAKAVDELRRCIVEPERTPDATLFDTLAELARFDARSAVTTSGTFEKLDPSELAPAVPQSEAPEAEAEEQLDAGSFLAALAEGGDDELESVLASIEENPPAPQERAPHDELGTLREPLADGARVLMKGELQPGLLSDLIQLFAQNKETGKLVIEGDGKADLFFEEGQITDAACAEEVGERAFYYAMQIRRGRFAYQRGVRTPEVRITRKTQHLIMDTLRLIDEATG